MATAPDPSESYDGNTDILDHLMREKKQNEQAEKRAQSSQEMFEDAKQQRLSNTGVDGLTNAEKGRRLEKMVRSRERKQRRQKRKKENFRSEAAKILEEFLQAQLDGQSVQTGPKHYERYVELNVTETTTPSDSSGFVASKTSLIREDSIPFADESDHELRKSESLPHDELANIHIQGHRGSIHHEKSRSAPYPKIQEVDYDDFIRKHPQVVRPTPPPPPGTPHSPSEEDTNGTVHKSVPYTGNRTDSSLPSSYERKSRTPGSSFGSSQLTEENIRDKLHVKGGKRVIQTGGGDRSLSEEVEKRDSLPKAPTTLALSGNTAAGNGAKSKFKTPTKGSFDSPRTFSSRHSVLSPKKSKTKSSGQSYGSLGSGYISSSDESPGHFDDEQNRGKKKMKGFKKAKARISAFFHLKSKHHGQPEDDDDYEAGHKLEPDHKSPPRRKKPKKQKHEEMDVDEADTFDNKTVLEDRVVSRTRHIRQTHSGGNTVLREEDMYESVDITEQDGSSRHAEVHGKVKQSSSGGGGFLSRLSHAISPKKDKKQVKDSLHDDEDQADMVFDVPRPIRRTGFDFDGGDYTDHANLQIYSNGGYAVTSMDSYHGDEYTYHRQMAQAVSKDDIRRHSSHLDIIDDQGKMIDRVYFGDEQDQLPRNKSFQYVQETEMHEVRVNDGSGVKVIRDVDTHGHFEMREGAAEGKPVKDMTETEKDEMYGKIAGRLAAMGDNLMTEKEMDWAARSSSTSPRGKMTPEQKISPESEEIKAETLTPLERELRDELRRFADDMDEKLAKNACQAAMRISGLVTYNHFKDVVQESVDSQLGWNQIAAVFQITKKAVEATGAGGALAARIKEMSLKYLEDRFANWIVAQGGWDSMLSDEETDSELD